MQTCIKVRTEQQARQVMSFFGEGCQGSSNNLQQLSTEEAGASLNKLTMLCLQPRNHMKDKNAVVNAEVQTRKSLGI
jgi:hypothetical protein